MFFFHGSNIRIKDTIFPHKAHCDLKETGNCYGIYCSNKCYHAFAHSIVGNKKNCSWSFNGIDTIKISDKAIIEEYGFIYIFESNDYTQLSKNQFLVHDSLKYFMRVKIWIPAFTKKKDDKIIILSDKIDNYIKTCLFLRLNFLKMECCISKNEYNILKMIDDFCYPNEIFYEDKYHGYDHALRVAYFALYLFKNNKTFSIRNLYILVKSCLYHDIGRFIDEKGVRHGQKGRDKYLQIYNKDKDDDISRLILQHDLEGLDRDDILLVLLKDADILDRARFGFNKVNVNCLIDENSRDLFFNHSFRELYEKKPQTIIVFPFSFGGAYISENSPLFLEHELKKNIIFSNIIFDEISKDFDSSPRMLLENLYIRLKNMNDKKCVILGGNHLSMLPVHIKAEENNFCSIVLDAHRDYISEEGYNHANFLKYIKKNQILIYGYRDRNNSDRPLNIYNFSKEEKKDFFDYIIQNVYLGKTFYIDIDVDVLDPVIFPCTYKKIEKGLNFEDIKEIFDIIGIERIRWLSISEYISYDDDNNYYQIIEMIINYFLNGIL